MTFVGRPLDPKPATACGGGLCCGEPRACYLPKTPLRREAPKLLPGKIL